MLNLDLKKAQELVAECIAERGEDYVYEKQSGSCMYVHNIEAAWEPEREEYEDDFTNATPGCLVGMALKKGGVPLETMGSGVQNDNGSYDLLNHLQAHGFVTFTDTASGFLANAQASQDAGAPWGLAVEAATRGMQLEPQYDEDTGRLTGKFEEREGARVA